MHKQCLRCNVNFEPEPGFYFGAMYVGYALTVALLVAVGIVLRIFFAPTDWTYAMVGISLAICFVPILFRYSRILFLYFFGGIPYNGELN